MSALCIDILLFSRYYIVGGSICIHIVPIDLRSHALDCCCIAFGNDRCNHPSNWHLTRLPAASHIDIYALALSPPQQLSYRVQFPIICAVQKEESSSSIHIIIKSESSHKCCASLSRLYNNISILAIVFDLLLFVFCFVIFLRHVMRGFFFQFLRLSGTYRELKTEREREQSYIDSFVYFLFCCLILILFFIWYGIAAIVDCSPMAQTNNRLGAFQSRAYIDSAADSPGSSYTPS